MRTIQAHTLTLSEPSPSLITLISPTRPSPKTITTNQGTSVQIPDVAPCDNEYDRAPSRRPGRPILSASRNAPRESTPHEDGKRVFEVKVLERHPFTTQSFLPMGSSAEKAYVVVVADDAEGGNKPDVASVRAFVMRGGEGVCYGVGTWHAPMCVVGEVRLYVTYRMGDEKLTDRS
jgi:ureidoglycolate lyase